MNESISTLMEAIDWIKEGYSCRQKNILTNRNVRQARRSFNIELARHNQGCHNLPDMTPIRSSEARERTPGYEEVYVEN